MRCAVFASGGGTNFQTLIDRKNAGDLHVEFVLCVGNNSDAGVFRRAEEEKIPLLHISPSHFDKEEDYTHTLLDSLNEKNCEFIILAGYMKLIPSEVVKKYKNRIVNIHPALLPAFSGRGMYGKNVHRAVIDYGAKITGVSVHFVDEEYDRGPIIFQEAVRVLDSDDPESLAARVLEVEHKSYWRVIEAVARGKISVKGRRVYGEVGR